MSNVVVGGLERNGCVTIQCLTQLFEDGAMTKEEYIEGIKQVNQQLFDYLGMLQGKLPKDAEVTAWHAIGPVSDAKRQKGDYIVKD